MHFGQHIATDPPWSLECVWLRCRALECGEAALRGLGSLV